MFHLKCFAIGLFILNFLCVYCNDMLKTCFISAELLLTVALIELRFIIAIIPQPFNGLSWNFQGIFLKSDIFRILQNTCLFGVYYQLKFFFSQNWCLLPTMVFFLTKCIWSIILNMNFVSESWTYLNCELYSKYYFVLGWAILYYKINSKD